MAVRHEALDRRPIASRERRVWKGAASHLARAGVSPDAISIAGMVTAMGAGAALALTSETQGWAARLWWLAGAVGVQLRLLANMLDGMVAIESGRASPVGEMYNEVPDRVSDAAVLIGLGYAAGGEPWLGYVAACLALFVAYVRAQGKAAGAANEFCGPMAKPHRMAVVTFAALAAAVAPAGWGLDGGPDGRWGLAAIGLAVIAAGAVVTAWRRLRRIATTLRGGAEGGS